jgi:hypothetical protein
VEPVIAYNQNGNKLDGIYAQSDDAPEIPIFDKRE